MCCMAGGRVCRLRGGFLTVRTPLLWILLALLFVTQFGLTTTFINIYSLQVEVGGQLDGFVLW